ncbi:MAG TPA: InlB B-repeat-containing protein, partial [Methanocorpusculum sp.]|nr:InlB B-repeat-containing protein [Methanocorpusculum sp.]
MLKCYVRGDPPAVFPKNRSVLLLAAVVLLVCCCLVVPAVVAEDVTVEPTVSIDSNVGTEAYNVSKIVGDAYYIEVTTTPSGSASYYNIGVNVTCPPDGDWDITFDWSDYIPGEYTWPPSDTVTSQGNSVISTIEVSGTSYNDGDGGERPAGSGSYYQVRITAKNLDNSYTKFFTKTFYVDVLFPIKPMDLTIYANDMFPKPRYDDYWMFWTWDNLVFKTNLAGEDPIPGKDFENHPFTINYYDLTTDAPVFCPIDSGIYTAVIEPKDGKDLSKFTIIAKQSSPEFRILFSNGTLTVLPTTENVTLSPDRQPSDVLDDNEKILACFDDTGYGYLNIYSDALRKPGKYQESGSPWYSPALFLQDDLLDEEIILFKDIAPEYFDGASKYEMKYFDLVADNIWVELLYDSPSVYWPYPEGTDEKTEFTLLYLDTRRSLDPATSIVGTPVKITPSKSDDKYLYFYRPSSGFSGFYALIWKDATDPVVIEPVNQTIYANENFPSAMYSGIEGSVEVNGQVITGEYPFEVVYYNTTTNTQISKPDTPGIYNATIQPASSVQLEQITIGGNPVTFRNGTLTVRQITDANETIPVAQQTRGGDGISVSVPANTIYYLNDNTSLPEVSAEKIHLLHDEILAGGEETLKRIAPGYFDDSSKYEMKYFDLIDTGNGHTWVSSSKDVTITWPYPEGTDENTEFTLLHYLDLHREYFTDEDLNSKTEPVTVSKTGSGVQFSIPQSGFSPFALIWSDQKPVPTPPSGGGSSDGNMDNAFRVLFNDGATTLFVVTDLSYGDKLTKPEDPVKDGYTFAGWYKDAACTQAWDFADGIAGDMTLYAKWAPVQTVTPTVTPTATASVTPTVTAEPSGLPTTTPTVQPTGEDDGGKPAGSVLPLVGGLLI